MYFIESWPCTYSRRARIALLPFWALFCVKNPFYNRDFLKVPFLSQKIHLFALFLGIMALFFNNISTLSTFTMIFSWKSLWSIATLWNFQPYAPLWFHIPHYRLEPTAFSLVVVISTLWDGVGICIGHIFVASDLPFWPRAQCNTVYDLARVPCALIRQNMVFGN